MISHTICTMWGKIFGPAAALAPPESAQRPGIVAVSLFLGALCLMVIGPAAALDGPRPGKLGWHMYASATYLPTIEVEMADGSREERQIGEIASGFRPEVDYFEPVARFLCAREPKTSRVHLTRERPERSEVIECSRF